MFSTRIAVVGLTVVPVMVLGRFVIEAQGRFPMGPPGQYRDIAEAVGRSASTEAHLTSRVNFSCPSAVLHALGLNSNS